MNEIIIGIIAGSIGGLIRTLITLSYGLIDKRKLNFTNIILYFFTFIFTGALAGLVFGPGKVLSFVMGFVGIDLLDTYYKAIMKKKVNIK